MQGPTLVSTRGPQVLALPPETVPQSCQKPAPHKSPVTGARFPVSGGWSGAHLGFHRSWAGLRQSRAPGSEHQGPCSTREPGSPCPLCWAMSQAGGD